MKQENEKYILKTTTDGKEITVHDVHVVLLAMMKDIDALCKKHNIQYFLTAGSTLGAIRHQGFIPWDDDMDIGMLYADYVKFLEVLKTELPEDYVFQCFDTHKDYNVTIPSMKIRKKGTFVKEKNVLLNNKCTDGNGIFVDVFVYDYVAESRFSDFINRMPNYLLMPIICIFENLRINPYPLKKFFVNHARRYSKRHNNSKLVGTDLAWTYQNMLKPFIHEYNTIYPVKYVPFEDCELPVPNDSHKFLCVEIAPSYMTPPPVSKRLPKHIMDINLEGEDGEKMENKKFEKKNIIIIALLFLAIVIGTFVFVFAHNNPMSILIGASDKLRENVEEHATPFLGMDTNVSKNYSLDATYQLKVESDMLQSMESEESKPYINMINNLSQMPIHVRYQQNLDEKKMALEVKADLKGKNVIDLSYMNENKKQFVLLKGIYENYLQLGDYDVFELLENNLTKENGEYLYNTTLDSLKANMKDSYFEKDKSTVVVNGKEKKATRVTLVLDRHNISELMANIVKDLKKDTKANDILTDISKEFKNYEPKVEKNKKEDTVMYYRVYVSGTLHTPLKYELTTAEYVPDYEKYDEETYEYKNKLQTLTIAYTENDIPTISIIQDKKVLGSATIKQDGENFLMTLKDGDNKKFGTLTYDKKGNKTEYILAIDMDGIHMTSNMKFNNQSTEKSTFELGMKVTVQNMNLMNLSLTGKTEIKDKTNFTSIPKNTKDIGTLTEAEATSIQEKLMLALATLMAD